MYRISKVIQSDIVKNKISPTRRKMGSFLFKISIFLKLYNVLFNKAIVKFYVDSDRVLIFLLKLLKLSKQWSTTAFTKLLLINPNPLEVDG